MKSLLNLRQVFVMLTSGLLLMWLPTAHSAYVLSSGGVAPCYNNVTYEVVDMSFCSSKASPASTALAIVTPIVAPTPASAPVVAPAAKERDCAGVGYSHSDDACGIPPTVDGLSVQQLSGSVTFGQTRINSSASLLGSEQRMRLKGIAISYMSDFGDWGYTVIMPIRQTTNNSTYSALNMTQIGFTFSPSYHLFKEQVHGMTLNLGGRFGYNRTEFADVAAVRNPSGPFNFADFNHFNTTFGGVNAQFSKALSSLTRLSLGIDAVTYRNDACVSMMGKSGNVLSTTAGLNTQISSSLSLLGTLQTSRMKQTSFSSTENFSALGVGLNYTLNPRQSLLFYADSTIGNGNVHSSSGGVKYQWLMQ